ncbi:MAG TPA: BON domain-containing protein [Sandaracinaceae bacterium LLY-WYZ-13_1]|nr:BON domain-containing protein [Sandaracinaceae bacterium LLY-WYZ-13_1]
MDTTTIGVRIGALAFVCAACGGAGPADEPAPTASDEARAAGGEARAEATPPAEGAEETRSPASDPRIAEAIRWELRADPAVGADRVAVEVEDGIATLRGSAPHLRMVDRAVDRARMIWGVRGVVSLVHVDERDRSDPAIAAAVRNALLIDPAAEAAELSVSVQDGELTLGGTVGSYAERRHAERTARAVSGVRAVDNMIEVASTTDRPDEEILADVEASLRADRWIDEWLLSARVEDGVVELDGVQPTAWAAERARRAAHVMGTEDVAASIRVEPFMAREMRRPPAGYQYPDDETIHRWVQRAIDRDPRVFRAEMDVDFVAPSATVILQGIVQSMDAMDAAEETALNVRGVREVDNRLVVDADPDDAHLSARIRRAFETHPAIQDASIEAVVDDGHVTLDGSVDALYTKLAAEDAVRRIPGVTGVDNTIDAPAPIPTAGMDDYVLRQQIRNRLRFHPYVDGAGIDVDVTDGSAVLTGTVDDWRSERSAIEAAYAAGATRVIDGLGIERGPHRRAP